MGSSHEVIAVEETTRLFSQQLLDEEQELKRQLRRLRDVATAGSALHEPGEPLRKRLRDMLALVMEAMGAHTAALLLLDSKTNQLVMSASTGDAVEELERLVGSADSTTFAGTIAAAPVEAVAVSDAETTGLEVSETLRKSGIHSLVGIRLSAHHSLRGVLYVGVRERRSFSAREVRRLETLGDELTTHLESARHSATLHAKLAEQKQLATDNERFASALLADLHVRLGAARQDARQLADLPQDGLPALLSARVLRNLDSVTRTVDDLIDVHEVRAGGLPRLRLAEHDLGALAIGVVEELRAVYRDRFVVRADKAVRGFWDAAQLGRALWHLVANAVEYGDQEAPIFVIIGSGPVHAKLAVHNEGPAISEEQQARLFEPYALPRSPGRRRHRHGWGIGLTLVWSCAEAHGGHVEVKSAPDKGTTFMMALPFDSRPYADG
jgi:signal transduction histidine kinase